MSSKNKYYAGIGSRSTPNEILEFQTRIATCLAKDGWLLSSGGAKGADEAFEKGISNISENRIIIPWNGFNNKYSSEGYIDYSSYDKITKETCEWQVSNIHPSSDKLSQGAKTLHSRNIMQILGPTLDRACQVCFILCTRRQT